MKIHDLQAIKACLDLDAIERRLVDGFRAYSAGQVQAPPVQNFQFRQANGDCCIKSAYLEGGETFVVKVSSGFYDNPGKGLPSNDGLMLVLSARTGEPLAWLADQGWLTAVRTALAGRIVARLLAPREVEAIGVLGTGLQARLQLECLMALTGCRQVVVWGRSEQGLSVYREHARALGFSVQTVQQPQAVAQAANLIVTTTPSREPLLRREWVRPGTHITAVGADCVGKQELDAALVASMSRIIVDSQAQCGAYGEVSHALKAGSLEPSRLLELGAVLAGQEAGRQDQHEVTLADLTGVAVQDAQIAQWVFERLRG
ncbi:ornithine cyclodeaminase family protein [Pseudomonas sp. B21-023]|uniref:ornithine cyclodeaminase family protein n=1 Tax=unclassified Pseudomonas TaxID=196821 RepID=UPI00111971B7|nr:MULTISPECIES: ornithine cyclodeaminase family protein [unclassified Pseudomonas]UVL19839.1 ornithine cyclodeaminase family protein [Pseudomonas sp. B21-044]UVM17222.1 ornithine cyclodeaminase family protein [Pseudomonas sp. B21-023]